MDDHDQQPPADDTVLVARSELELPDGGIVENTLFIVSYFDEQGASRYAWAMQGQSNAASMLGIMELVRFSMLVETMS